MSRDYWAERTAKAQEKLTNKNIKATEKQLRKYYKDAAQRVMKDFELTYARILRRIEEGKQVTPADLYKLDKYWQLQGTLRKELTKLGEKQIAALTRQFEVEYFDIYYSFALDGTSAFTTLDKEVVNQALSSIWCADGKSFSQRIWGNTEKLVETLNDELIAAIATGRKTTDLKHKLMERFNVAFNNADSIVKTEMAHIQTEAAKQRYRDYGIQEVEIWADKDERRCDVCGELHQKRYPVGANIPIPAHPRCRCCIVPVVD